MAVDTGTNCGGQARVIASRGAIATSSSRRVASDSARERACGGTAMHRRIGSATQWRVCVPRRFRGRCVRLSSAALGTVRSEYFSLHFSIHFFSCLHKGDPSPFNHLVICLEWRGSLSWRLQARSYLNAFVVLRVLATYIFLPLSLIGRINEHGLISMGWTK